MKSMLIIGAGIAGASLAYQATKQGWTVTVVDAGGGRASDVPAALLNPVRGQGGRVPAGAVAGMAHTWALIDELQAQGYPVPHGKTGVLRPIPDEKTYRKWQANLPPELPHEWLDPAQCPHLPQHWYKVLYLPQAGWLSGGAFCRALLAAGGAVVVRGNVVTNESQHVMLKGGETLLADVVVNCTGSGGAAEGEGTHRAGSVLLLRSAPTPPSSFGVYLSPTVGGGVLGGTFEAPQGSHAAALAQGLPLHSLGWLLGKAAALTDLSKLEVTGQWTGVRFSGVDIGTQPDEAGVYHLRGLGSKGFLLGPLLAAGLLEDLPPRSAAG